MISLKYCPKCNSLGDENDTVCAECGSKLEELTLDSDIFDKKTNSKISMEPIRDKSTEIKTQLNKVIENKVVESKEEKKVKNKELELKIIILLLAIILLIVILYMIFSSK